MVISYTHFLGCFLIEFPDLPPGCSSRGGQAHHAQRTYWVLALEVQGFKTHNELKTLFTDLYVHDMGGNLFSYFLQVLIINYRNSQKN